MKHEGDDGLPGRSCGDRFPFRCMTDPAADEDPAAQSFIPECVADKNKKQKPDLLSHSFSCMQHMSYPRWCAMLVSQVLRCRTPFAAFVSKTIQLSRRMTHRGTPAPTFFPIPLPPADFGRMPASISSARRHRVHLARTVHLVCMALNYWHSGGVFADDISLQRGPNRQHTTLYERIKALVRSEGPSEVFEISQTGRKFPNLVARLAQLSDWLTIHGSSSNPYEKVHQGLQEPFVDLSAGDINPYSDLDPNRLVLHGTGHWNACPFLPDDMTMAYLEPRSILVPEKSADRPTIRDSAETLVSLAKKWDEQGLLVLHRRYTDPISFVRIFNAKKSALVDRQIGDRRGANGQEAKLLGPSHLLPSGCDLVELSCNPSTHTVKISITDRKDFYHQLWASPEKSWRNTLAPSVPLSELVTTAAYKQWSHTLSKKRYAREKHGDGLHGHTGDHPPNLPDDHCWISFGSVLQGDHTGVEVATAAHISLLQSKGLLDNRSTLQANRCIRDEKHCQGLVIDDYFSLSVESVHSEPSQSLSSQDFQKAQEAYTEHSLLGSPQKDIEGADSGRVIGAFVNSSKAARDRKLVTVAAPIQKRISLAVITMQVCQLTHTTDSLHLCLLGAWVSVLGYRRPLMSVLAHSFKLVDSRSFDPNNPQVIHLPRCVVTELTLLSVLMPLAVADLSAQYHPEIFCSDASSQKGAYCSASIPQRLIPILWKTERSKGAYTRLLSPAETVLARLDENVQCHPFVDESPQKPIAFHYDFLEVYAGAALITRHLLDLGVSCGPAVELSFSAQYNMEYAHVAAWICFMLSESRLKAVFLCPPCTTFSIMRRPPLRDADHPWGFDVNDPQTRTGTLLANRACQVMKVADQNNAVGILEAPFSSKIKHLPAWKAIQRLPSAMTIRADSCRFGSIHQKGFKFLSVNADTSAIALKCICKTRHVPVQGVYTKSSAIYVEPLARGIALCIHEALKIVKRKMQSDLELEVRGLESQLVNEVIQTSHWQVRSSWTFKKQSHINILEMASVLRLANKMAEKCVPLRLVNCVDSYVTRCAASKGRTSSCGLTPVLRRLNAVSVAGGLFWTFPFAPTRWNPSDDPTRDCVLRQPIQGFIKDDWTDDQIYDLAALPKTKRWASNWMRLTISLLGPQVLELSDRSRYRQTSRRIPLPANPCISSELMDFDASLGFPGEGPQVLHMLSRLGVVALSCCFVCCGPCRCPLWIAALLCSGSPAGCCWCLLVGSGFPAAMSMPMFPKNPGEISRANARAARPPLPEGRPVLPVTSSLRERYLAEFFNWALENDFDIRAMLDNHLTFIDELNIVLAKYGRELYRNGKTYAQYAETINGISSAKPAVRRLLQGAWDFGYSWVRLEPSSHHIAMPSLILVSMIATSLMWGWLAFAGCLAVGFGGLLRPGEFLSGIRRDLLIPADIDNSIDFVVFTIQDPKTRFTQARHQSSKIDSPDLVDVIQTVFGRLGPHQRLWPMSGQTFRTRFRSVLAALKLPTTTEGSLKPLDPGSLRAGGASFLLLSTEDSELVRRRGRWSNHRMMEIYVQELTALTYSKHLHPTTLKTVAEVARTFPAVLQKAKRLLAAKVPVSAWHVIFSS